MNRAQIRALVEENTRRTDKTTLINSAIDFAVSEVSKRRFWQDLLVEQDFSLLTGQSSIALPSTAHRLVEARLIVSGSTFHSRTLEIRPKTWVVDRYPNIDDVTAGKPHTGYLEAGTLYLVPGADQEYTIRVSWCKLHPALSTDASELLITQADQAVIAYATFWTFQSIEKHDDAKRWLEIFEGLIRTAIKVDRDNPIIRHKAEIRGEPGRVPSEYWNDPFQKYNP